MTGMPVKVILETTGDFDVRITRTSGGSLTVYSDAACTTPVSMPSNITTTTTYYVPNADLYTVSVKRNSVEAAAPGGMTRQAWLRPGVGIAFAPDMSVEALRTALGAGPVDVDGAVKAGTELQGTGLRVGPNTGAPTYGSTNSNGTLNQYGPMDLLWDPDSIKLYSRGVIIGDYGDPPDLCLRRAELTSQGDYPAGTPAPITDTTNLGTFYWMGWAYTGSGNGGFQNRAAQIYVRSKGDQTLSNHGGELFINSMPQDTAGNPPDTVGVRHNGNVDLMRGGLGIKSSGSAPSAATSGYGQLYVQNGALYFKGTSGTVTKIADA